MSGGIMDWGHWATIASPPTEFSQRDLWIDSTGGIQRSI
jgi:hypothetical protein